MLAIIPSDSISYAALTIMCGSVGFLVVSLVALQTEKLINNKDKRWPAY
jgi:archaellum biogenesis protein FlaJ (TadC family)